MKNLEVQPMCPDRIGVYVSNFTSFVSSRIRGSRTRRPSVNNQQGGLVDPSAQSRLPGVAGCRGHQPKVAGCTKALAQANRRGRLESLQVLQTIISARSREDEQKPEVDIQNRHVKDNSQHNSGWDALPSAPKTPLSPSGSVENRKTDPQTTNPQKTNAQKVAADLLSNYMDGRIALSKAQASGDKTAEQKALKDLESFRRQIGQLASTHYKANSKVKVQMEKFPSLNQQLSKAASPKAQQEIRDTLDQTYIELAKTLATLQ